MTNVLGPFIRFFVFFYGIQRNKNFEKIDQSIVDKFMGVITG